MHNAIDALQQIPLTVSLTKLLTSNIVTLNYVMKYFR